MIEIKVKQLTVVWYKKIKAANCCMIQTKNKTANCCMTEIEVKQQTVTIPDRIILGVRDSADEAERQWKQRTKEERRATEDMDREEETTIALLRFQDRTRMVTTKTIYLKVTYCSFKLFYLV